MVIVTLYTDLLRARMAADAAPVGHRVAELVAALIAGRSRLGSAAHGPGRLDEALAYDLALARLCEALGIVHHLADPGSAGTARRSAEEALAVALPAVGDKILTGTGAT